MNLFGIRVRVLRRQGLNNLLPGRITFGPGGPSPVDQEALSADPAPNLALILRDFAENLHELAPFLIFAYYRAASPMT
jgi:hypothetical protein